MKSTISSEWLGLPETLATELRSRASSQKLKAGDVLFAAGDDGDGCYRLERGTLKVILTSPHGEERILALLSSGTVVGDLSMIDGLPRSATVIALNDCEVCFVSRTAFREYVERHPEVHRYLTGLLASRLRETDDTIAALAFLTWRGRVARALLEVAAVMGDDRGSGGTLIQSMVSQRELAAMAGVARENVSRALGEWRRRKIIRQSDGALEICDKSALEREIRW